jgi:hypothetical protein
MPIMQISDTAAHAAQELDRKLGTDDAAAALVATIMAAFGQLALLYEESEARHGANLLGAASFLTRLGESMTSMDADLAARDRAAAELHAQVKAKLLSAGNSVASARRSMDDVLKLYNDFSGNANQLKQGVASLAKSILSSLNPALGAWAGPRLDEALKLS